MQEQQTHFITKKPKIYTVSELNQQARLLLEGQFPLIWLEGEVSNVAKPRSGHVYFTLKDAQAQVRCAMFRMKHRLIGFELSDGQLVQARVKVSLYEGRGDYQCIVEMLQEAGDGQLQRAFLQVKQQLADKGLFASEKKLPLPTMPKTIGVITSATGAAIRDILTVLKRRFASIPVIIYPTAVQGKQATPSLVNAIKLANQHQACDVLILARGGGSLEDLWGFNEEALAYAMSETTIPIITGIGHEVDTTIADYVASKRAATPSAAAEIAVPDKSNFLQQFVDYQQRLIRAIAQVVLHQEKHLQLLSSRLQHPGARLEQQSLQLDHLEQRLSASLQTTIHSLKNRLQQCLIQLHHLQPTHKIIAFQTQLTTLQQNLLQQVNHALQNREQQLQQLMRALHTVSPLATLDRGFAIATDHKNKIIRNSHEINCGDKMTVQFAKGKASCIVEAKD